MKKAYDISQEILTVFGWNFDKSFFRLFKRRLNALVKRARNEALEEAAVAAEVYGGGANMTGNTQAEQAAGHIAAGIRQLKR